MLLLHSDVTHMNTDFRRTTSQFRKWDHLRAAGCIITYSPLQIYWNSEVSPFVFALGLTSKDEYETRDQFDSFISRY